MGGVRCIVMAYSSVRHRPSPSGLRGTANDPRLAYTPGPINDRWAALAPHRDVPTLGADWRHGSRQENTDLRRELADVKSQATYDAHHSHQVEQVFKGHDQSHARVKQLEVENYKLRGMMGNGNRVPGLKDEISKLKAENEDLRRVGTAEIERLLKEIDRLNAEPKVTDQTGLGPEFAFGRKVYQCLIDSDKSKNEVHNGNPGVGYRFTPVFENKNPDGSGPVYPEIVIADNICQGPHAVFIRDESGRGWLPLAPPPNWKGKSVACFKLLGDVDDVDLSQYHLSAGENKLSDSLGGLQKQQ